MGHNLFRTESFPVKNASKIACLVAGYRGKITGYKDVIRDLNRHGFSVVAYEHSPSVLTDGNPRDLLDLVQGIYADFVQKITGHKEMICVGASIGAGIGIALQRRIPNIKYGIYAGAGVSPPETIFQAPLFYFARKAFTKNGYNAAKLKSLWKEDDILPELPPKQSSPFMIVLGKQDKIVSYKKATATFQAWQAAGVMIKIITKSDRGHVGAIRWLKKHFGELLTEAELLYS